MKHITIFWGLLSLLILCSCTNFEELRRDKFVPDYAVKNPTTFIESKSVNGRFLKSSLIKGEPLMLLKTGLGYSAVQLHSGSIGEIPSEDMREKEEGEDFEAFYARYTTKPSSSSYSASSSSAVRQRSIGVKLEGVKAEPSSDSGEVIETFPILNNSLESVEPNLPDW
jgi:hypothetical protein